MAAVGDGDGLHDCEPEAGTGAAARFVTAGEALERASGEAGRKAGAFVGHVDLDTVVALDARDPDRSGSVA